MNAPAGMAAAQPVICIGNFTAGGTGKTPLAIWLAHHLTEQGLSPVFLTRGFGSAVRRPTAVDLHIHQARDVGDEALLLARAAPVMVSPDRIAGARAIAESDSGAGVIVMDDGLQNPTLIKDFTIAVVDGARGFGNGRVIPAGPLRAPLSAQLARTDVIVVNGRREDRDRIAALIEPAFTGPILQASAEAIGDTAWLGGERVMAFAGIGNPDRFFRLLDQLGAVVVGKRRFADHHAFTDQEAARLVADAQQLGARLVTTEKDFVRISQSGAQADLRQHTRTLPIGLQFGSNDAATLLRRISDTLARRLAPHQPPDCVSR